MPMRTMCFSNLPPVVLPPTGGFYARPIQKPQQNPYLWHLVTIGGNGCE